MSRLYLHIGSHKTGTTSIQKACRRHLATGRADVRYIDIRPPRPRILQSAGRLENFRAGILLDEADRLFRPDKLRPARDGSTRFIASDEELFWIHEPDSVAALADLLRQRFERIIILAYLRRPDRLAVSHRKQVLGGKMPAARFYGIETSPLPVYRPHLHRYFDYAAKLGDVWGAAFGPEALKVIPYRTEALEGGDVVSDFAHRTGAVFRGGDQERANSALDGDRVLVGLKLAQFGVPKPLRERLLEELPGRGRYLPARAEAEAFAARFAADGARLARDFRWEGAPFAFETGFDMYPETTDGQWSNADVEAMLDAVLRAALAGRRGPQADKDHMKEP